MPVLELVDETYVAGDPARVARAVHDPGSWAAWWPDLALTPFMDRGPLGLRWSAAGRDWHGSIEIWLEPVGDGVLIHHYQRLDPLSAVRPPSNRAVARERARRARDWKHKAFALKDAIEGTRRPGTRIHSDGSSLGEELPTLGG